MSRISKFIQREQAWLRVAECPSIEAREAYEKAISEYAKAQTADEENRLFDKVISATDALREASNLNISATNTATP